MCRLLKLKKIVQNQMLYVMNKKNSKNVFFKALKEADDIRAGKKEAIDLDELLNEL